MAKKITKAATLPAGFEELSATMAGFFDRKPGNTIQGTLIGSFTVKGKYGEKKVHRIKITDGETAVTDKEGPAVAGLDDVVGLDETGYLKRLSDLGDGQEVFIRCVSKGDSQKDPWIFQVAVRS